MMTVLYKTKMYNPDADVVDRLPSKDRVSNWDIAGFIFSIISHLVDIIFDCNIAYRYCLAGHVGYFCTTVSFILVPALINTAFSIRMYMLDSEEHDRSRRTLTDKFTKRKICCVIVLIFQLAPVLRYFDALQYALKSKKAEKNKDVQNQRKYYELMVKEDSDVALLRVLECFLEAAPQQILQLSIILYNKEFEGNGEWFYLFHQLLSIGSSFVSMAWSMASYQRLLRVSLRNKHNISWAGTLVQFMWHFLVTVSRILCISVVASILPVQTVLLILVHWFVMTTWLTCTNQKNNFCEHSKFYDLVFFSVFGTVYIFTPVTLSEGPTRIKYAIFYTILFVENTIANIVWILSVNDDTRSKSYYLPIVVLNAIPFCLGLIFMVLYYKVFHPSTGYHRQRIMLTS